MLQQYNFFVKEDIFICMLKCASQKTHIHAMISQACSYLKPHKHPRYTHSLGCLLTELPLKLHPSPSDKTTDSCDYGCYAKAFIAAMLKSRLLPWQTKSK